MSGCYRHLVTDNFYDKLAGIVQITRQAPVAQHGTNQAVRVCGKAL